MDGPSCSHIPRTLPRFAPPNWVTWPGLKPEFDKRNTKIIGLSVDPVDNHTKWAQDIEETQGYAVDYPMIGDTELKVGEALRHAARRCRGEPAMDAPRPTMPPCARIR